MPSLWRHFCQAWREARLFHCYLRVTFNMTLLNSFAEWRFLSYRPKVQSFVCSQTSTNARLYAFFSGARAEFLLGGLSNCYAVQSKILSVGRSPRTRRGISSLDVAAPSPRYAFLGRSISVADYCYSQHSFFGSQTLFLASYQYGWSAGFHYV